MSSDIITNEFIDKYKNKQPNWGFNGLGYIVYKRTYARPIEGENRTEEWPETIQRCINGAQKIGANYTKDEAEKLFDYIFNLKCNFAGRMLWQLGTSTVDRFGANSLLNCWMVQVNNPSAFCFLFENLMLGGGVGFSVKKEDVHELPKVKKGVNIAIKNTKDADYIVPDSREGWVSLLRKVLESYFETGKGFSYSTILVRGSGEPINGFGGTSSGPKILEEGIEKICNVIKEREGKKLRSLDCLDICNIIGSVVVAGNVRRSAEIALGDPDDFLFLRAKRWDLGNIPNWRAMSNNTIYADDYDHIMESVWDGYAGNGEPYGFFNLPLSQAKGRTKDSANKADVNAVGTNPSLVGNTLVQSQEHGIIPIKQLDGVNFSVKSLDGKIVNASCWKSGVNKSVTKIEFGKHKEILCTPEHKWPVFKDGKIQNIPTSKLKEGDLIPLNRNENLSINCHDYSEDEGFLVGYLLGDGWLGKRDNGNLYCGFTFSLEEKHVAQKVLKIVNSLKKNKSNITKNHGNELNIQITDQNFCKLLIDKYQIPLNKKDGIPQTVFQGNDDFIKGFVDGLISSDGCVSIKENRITLTSSRKSLAIDFAKLISFYGIKATIASRIGVKASFPNKREYERTYDRFDVRINGFNCLLFRNVFSLSHEGKQGKLKKINSSKGALSSFQKITKITEKYSKEDVWDISVDYQQHVFPCEWAYSGNCGEISLENYECCNLSELYLNNITSKEEMVECSKLLYKTQKAICALPFIHEETNRVVHKNFRIGQGITGICQSSDKIKWLDFCYTELKKFDKEWSKEMGWPKSIKLTTVKPSGTLSILAGATPGVHPAFSKYYIRRVRMSSSDKLIELCRKLGYKVEYALNFDGSQNHDTSIVEFPCQSGDNAIIAKEMSAINQLDLVKTIQSEWSDNAVSCTVYYKKEELPEIKEWLRKNYKNNIKSVSFLLHSEHGFQQAPYQEIDEKTYNKLQSRTRPISSLENLNVETGDALEGLECEGGACPIK